MARAGERHENDGTQDGTVNAAPGGRHYGRPAIREPAPDGGPPGAIPGGDAEVADAAIRSSREAEEPDEDRPEAHTQGRHGEAFGVQGRRGAATPGDRGPGRA